MTDILWQIGNALLLVSALSLDAFVASFSYGVNKIKIPFKSAAVINLVCRLILAAALFAGVFLSNYISPDLCSAICCIILITIGLIKLFDSWISAYIKKHQKIDKNIKFKFLSLKFILHIYADPPVADADESKILSAAEAVSLAFALSLDGLTAGIGAGMGGGNFIMILCFSVVTDLLAVIFGNMLGKRISKTARLNLGWLGGIIFIGLGISKLFL